MKKFLMIMILFVLAGATGCKEQNKMLKSINNEINAFVENHVADYLQNDNQDIYVARAFAKLSENGYSYKLSTYLDEAAVKSYYDGLEYDLEKDPIANIFKALIIGDLYNYKPAKALAALAEYEDTAAWNHPVAYMAVKVGGVNASFGEAVLAKMTVIKDEDYRDADFAGMALMATSFKNESNKNIDKTIYYNLISNSLGDDGVESWGAANSCSTAMVILGLLADEKDPTKHYEVNLIEALLAFVNDGAASYHLGDEADLMFSTPQVMAALMAYKVYAEKGVFVNIFN